MPKLQRSANHAPDKDPGRSATEVSDVGEVVDDYEYDLDTGHRTWPKTTLVLLVGVLMSVAFTGGVLVQKENDKGLTSASNALPAGFPPGGFGAAAGGAAGAAGAAPGGAGAAAAASTGPVLVGTVVSVSGNGGSVTVKDLGGTTHAVSTTGTTTVSRQEQKKVTDLAAGDTVSINGARATDGSVAATAFTIR
jgi:hypothetical protein